MYAASSLEDKEGTKSRPGKDPVMGLMWEFRQDLVSNPQWRETLLKHLDDYIVMENLLMTSTGCC